MNIIDITKQQFDAEREIPRLPDCPNLSPEQIKIITETLFVNSNPQPADILFVFGSSFGDMWPQVVKLYKDGLAPVVYLAGGIGNASFEKGKILSHIIRDEFIRLGVPEEAIVLDEKSRNTLEDALFGKQIFIKEGIAHDRILFACKAPHSGRCLRTLKKVFTYSELFCFTYDICYEGKNITADNWMNDENARRWMWGEYERINLYSSRGDICP